jgi:hypothetical protein
MATRSLLAYVVPASLLIGAAISELASSFLLLAQKASTGQTTIWRVSVLTWAILAFYSLVQFVTVDYINSPYPVPVPLVFLGVLTTISYTINALTTIGITTLLVLRIRIFFGEGSMFYTGMLSAAVFVVLLKTGSSILGVYVSLSIANGEYTAFGLHPLYKVICALR